jgi:hypothetical protein
LWVAVLLSITVLTGCGDESLQSRTLDREIVIDGTADEWVGATTWFEDAHLAVGVFHDEDNLYLSLRSRNMQANRQIIMGGLELRFQPASGTSGDLAVRYPLGMDPSDMPRRPPGGERGGRGDREPPRPGFDSLAVKRKEDQDWLTFRTDEYTGIEVAASMKREEFVCEMKLPLRKGESTPYALSTVPGSVLTLVAESRRPDLEQMRGRMGGRGGGMGGGMGGRGGGMGGGVGGRGPGMDRPDTGEPLKLRAKIVLGG